MRRHAKCVGRRRNRRCPSSHNYPSPRLSFVSETSEQPLKGRRLLERRLTVWNALREKDVQDIFAHGEPLVFDGDDYPRRLVPEIVEVGRRSTKAKVNVDFEVFEMRSVSRRKALLISVLSFTHRVFKKPLTARRFSQCSKIAIRYAAAFKSF